MAEPANRKPPALQDRSKKTEDLILKTALRILGDSGAAALTTANVSAAAGISVGTIYRRFGNKEELLRQTQLAFLEEFQGYLFQQWGSISAKDATDPAATIVHATRSLAMSFYLYRRPLRQLFIVGLQNPTIYADGHKASVAGGQRYSNLILPHRDRILHDDPEAAVEFTYRLTYAASTHRITQGPELETSRATTWEETVAELARANRAYLLAP